MSNNSHYQIELNSEAEQLAFGGRLAEALIPGVTVFLHGDLGVGKTTLCRGIVNGFGFEGNVKSPTYTLVEPYKVAGQMLYHFDLYRLGEATELEYMGCRDYFDDKSICLIEWPERGAGVLPAADLELQIQVQGQGRRLLCQASSDKGLAILKRLSEIDR